MSLKCRNGENWKKQMDAEGAKWRNAKWNMNELNLNLLRPLDNYGSGWIDSNEKIGSIKKAG